MRKILLLTAFAFFEATVLFAQDPHFSQYRNTPLFVNPAYTGDFPGKMRAIVNYRSQWVSAGAPFKTAAASFDMPVYRSKRIRGSLFGGGIAFFSDRAGDVNLVDNNVTLSASGIIAITRRTKFGVGLQGGAGQRSIDLSNLVWGNQYTGTGQGYDPTLPSGEGSGKFSFWYPDISAGVFYEYNSSEYNFTGRDIFIVNVGAAVYHVNTPDISFSTTTDKLYMKYVGHLNCRYDVKGTKWGVLPSAIYLKQGPHQEINFGLLGRYRLKEGMRITGFQRENALLFGLYYRNKDAIIGQFYLEIADYSLGLSYDFTVGGFGLATGGKGGFELSLKYNNISDAVFKRDIGD